MLQGALMWPTGRLSERQSQIVEVYCANCQDSIGSMDMLTLSSAIHTKGTVLCPQCRSLACKGCGVVGRLDDDGLCAVCRWTLVDDELMELVGNEFDEPIVRMVGRDGEVRACHIVHNSNGDGQRDE